MKIAMLGIKGLPVPAGAEVVVEEIGSRLVERGHEVLVYVRPHYTPREQKEYLGMKLIHLPSIPKKNLDAFTHSLLASMAVLREQADIVHIHSTGNSIFALHPRAFGSCTVVTSHGLDWQRAKWGRLARAYLHMTDYTTTHFPNITTAVSQKMQRYYEDKFHQPVVYIPNGVKPAQKKAPVEMRKLGLNGNDYILFAARLVPEKGAHYLIEAYKRLVNTKLKLVIAGDGVLGDAYAKKLKEQASDSILFPGFVSGPLKQELLSNGYMFVLPSEIEGLSTGLMEAMSYGNCVLASDIEENIEVIADAGVTFRSGETADLHNKLTRLILHPEDVKTYRNKAKHSVSERYNWEDVTDAYEQVYRKVLAKH